MEILNDLRPIPGSEAFRGGRGGGHIVTDFVTRLMRPKYLLKKSDRYMYVYIYIYMCVCVNVCVYVCVCMCLYYIIICIIYFFRHP